MPPLNNEMLFKDLEIEDYILDIKYDGPSFDGIMEIGALTNEVVGIDICIKTIVSYLRQDNKMDLVGEDFSIVVEAFQKNCFRKKIKFIGRHMNKYPVLYTTVSAILAASIAIIPQLGANKIREMSPATMAQISDKTQVELLKNPQFLSAIANIIKPLLQDKDYVEFTQPTHNANRTLKITYSQKSNFMDLTAENIESVEMSSFGEIYGRIVEMDIDARKNQMGFKQNGEGEQIRCSVRTDQSISAYTHLLGKWVTLSGNIVSVDQKIKHIAVEKIVETGKKGQFELGLE